MKKEPTADIAQDIKKESTDEERGSRTDNKPCNMDDLLRETDDKMRVVTWKSDEEDGFFDAVTN